MKINARLLSIIFFVVVIMSVSSGIIYYSFTVEILRSQQLHNLENSKKDFIFSFHNKLLENDYEIDKLIFANEIENLTNRTNVAPDFVFIVNKSNISNVLKAPSSANSPLKFENSSIKQFAEDNPSYLIQYKKISEENYVYYGNIINADYLNRFSEKVNAEIAVVNNGVMIHQSHGNINEIHNDKLTNVLEKFKSNYREFYESIELQNEELAVTVVHSARLSIIKDDLQFIIYNKSTAQNDFSDRMFGFFVTITFAGIALSLIMVLLFTSKMRAQIKALIDGVEETSKGDFKHRVPVVSTTELGKLGSVYNRMLDELEKREKRESEYSSFISLINKNPGLNKVSESTLEKIIKSTKVSFGVLYLIENESFRTIATYGLNDDSHTVKQNKDIISILVNEQQIFEKVFTSNFPSINLGHLSVSIKSVLMVPIIYNGKTVAVVELLSEKEIQSDIKDYLLNIREQLAIGLTNANTFAQLENLVEELQNLNEDSQIQNKKLKELSDELTIKAAELDKQKNKALELSKAKSQFLANMSHELKTPLNSILGLTELSLKENKINTDQKEKLEVVLRNGKRLLALINNILEFSKLESKKSVLNIQKFNLSDVVNEISNIIKPLADQKNLELKITGLEKRDYFIELDQEKLEQIVINLLSNAVKFTSTGFVELIIKNTKKNLILKVVDSGIGIPEEFKTNLFEEFEQADGGNTKKFGGAGLGLAICKKYCSLLGASIDFESDNKGTVFTVEFPKAVLEKIKIDTELGKGNYKSNAILVYNNNKLSALLEEYLPNYEIESAERNCNVSALDVYNSVIIDLANDFMGAFEFGNSLRSDKRFNNSAIIYTYMGDSYSYALNIFDYSNDLFEDDNFFKCKNRVERFLGDKVTSVVIYSKFSEKIRAIREKILLQDNSIELHIFEETDVDVLGSLNPDLIVSDLIVENNNMVDFLYAVKSNANTKNIPIVINQNIESPESVVFIKEAIENLVSSINWVPQDILRIIRNRLKINYKEEVKSNLFEEQIETSENEKDLIEDKNIEIMIVDDDSDTLFTVNEIIKKEGYKTRFANNGLECLNQLSISTPDLILLDIMMPVMDGFETIKRIRMLPKYQKLPVLALTAHAMLENKEVINKNGFDGIVTKPLNSKILIKSVKETLDRL